MHDIMCRSCAGHVPVMCRSCASHVPVVVLLHDVYSVVSQVVHTWGGMGGGTCHTLCIVMMLGNGEDGYDTAGMLAVTE